MEAAAASELRAHYRFTLNRHTKDERQLRVDERHCNMAVNQCTTKQQTFLPPHESGSTKEEGKIKCCCNSNY